MIVFETEFAEYFNNKIHEFLLVELFDDYREEDFYESLEWFFPKHLVREQKKKCATVMWDLYEWTADEYWHTMTAFHEIGLYKFLDYMDDLRTDMAEFDRIYYNEDDKKELEALMSKLDIGTMFECTIKNAKELGNFLHDISTFQSLCFEDADFLLLPILSNNQALGDNSLEMMMDIDFEYYKELLPNDIRAKYVRSARKQSQTVRLGKETPATNLTSIAKLIDGCKIMAYFDPYLDNVALQNLSTIVSLTSGAILAKDIRFISSVKVVKNQRPRLTRIFADSWFKEHSLEEGKIRVEQSGKEHRRFILLHDDRVLIIPFSLNRLNVNETAHIEVDSNDKSFFEEQWKISLPLE